MEPVVPLARPGAADVAAPIGADLKLQHLLEEYGSLLRRTIAKVCPRELGLSCDDIEQEARVSLWTALKGEREIQFPASYIYRVAVSATLRAIRQTKARREDQLTDPESDDEAPAGPTTESLPAAPETSPHERAERSELARTIQRAVNDLAEPRRIAVGLHLQGLTTTEIGKAAGWTEAKARNLVHRGLKDLRVHLRALGIEYGT